MFPIPEASVYGASARPGRAKSPLPAIPAGGGGARCGFPLAGGPVSFPRMSKVLRIGARVLAGIGILAALAAALAAGAVWLTLPPVARSARVPGLSAPVAVTYDQDWVPRIHAQSALDGAAALGFLHAGDRLFQMELMRRAASGRLAALAGPAALPVDRMMRVLGLRARAAGDLATLPADARAMLAAYARGVNAFIALKGRFAAPEFLLLGRPEPWEPVDSLLWAKVMGLWLSMNERQELARLALADKVPAAVLEGLWPAQPPGPGPEAMATPLFRYAAAARRLLGVLPVFPAPFTQPQTASNEWAVDGRHTATGAPLLAGDPHLGFTFPGIWYLARIETPDGVLAGATAPGVPFLVLGRNSRIAWTFTTTGADVQDVFIETPAGPGRYMTPEGPRPFSVREETIKVRGGPDQTLVVRESRHGPIISDLDNPLGNPSGPILAAAMGNLQPGDTAAAGLMALNRAGTVPQAGEAAREITSPVQNLLVADARTIGLFVTGQVPIRRAGDGEAPVPGDGAFDWIGWASGDRLPHYLAPGSGRLVNGNEPVWPPDFPVFMGHDTFDAWRAERIRTMLARADRHTAADFAAMQADVEDPFAVQALPVMLAVTGVGGTDAQALELLRGWDGRAVMDSPAPLIFNAWRDAFHAAVLRRAGLAHGLGEPVADFLSRVLSPAGAQWCGGDCAPLLRESLAQAVRALRARFGDDPKAWRWGEAHRAVFAHPLLSRLPLIGPYATISIPSPGDNETVDRGGTDPALQSVHGASYRGVYDLSDLDRSLFIMAPGQSGNLFSPHARDFLTRWRDGATVTLGPEPARTTATVRLTP